MNEFINNISNFKNNGLTIVITAYKSQDFIEECLDSIQNQTYFKYNDNYEILLGIDACEFTLKKVKEIKKKYGNLKVFYASENGGTYRMRNSLWIRAKYENLLFFDSDDVMPNNFIKDVMKHSSNDMIRFGVKTFKVVNGKNTLDGTKYTSFGSVLIKKKLMEYVKGYYDERISMDDDLISRISKIKNIYITDIYFLQRHHGNSLTASPETGFKSEKRKKVFELMNKRKQDDIIINDEIVVNKSLRVV